MFSWIFKFIGYFFGNSNQSFSRRWALFSPLPQQTSKSWVLIDNHFGEIRQNGYSLGLVVQTPSLLPHLSLRLSSHSSPCPSLPAPLVLFSVEDKPRHFCLINNHFTTEVYLHVLFISLTNITKYFPVSKESLIYRFFWRVGYLWGVALQQGVPWSTNWLPTPDPSA